MVVPLSSIPPSRDGFYAINNQFLANGPKGFQELKTLEKDDMFIRIDFPGVPEDGIKVVVDPTKKAVTVFAFAPKEHKHDSSPRNYLYTTGLVCKCCDISAAAAHMSDGVLRLLSKIQVATQCPRCGIVMVTGDAPAVSHDSGGRFYSGEVAMLATPIDIHIRQIKIIAKNGVIRLIIPPA